MKPNLTLGLSFGWHVFDEQTDEVVSAFGVDHQRGSVPLHELVADPGERLLFLRKPGPGPPFLGANVGVYIMEHRLDIGLYTIHETNGISGSRPKPASLSDQAEHVAVLTGRYNYALAPAVWTTSPT